MSGSIGVRERRVLLLSPDAALASALAPALAVRGIGLDVHAGAQLERAAEELGSLLSPPRGEAPEAPLIVCDCAGEWGLARAFFAARAARRRTVALLVTGGAAEYGPAVTLMAACIKARPELRIAVVTDRVAEESRACAAERRAAWSIDDLACALCDLIDGRRNRRGDTIRLQQYSRSG